MNYQANQNYFTFTLKRRSSVLCLSFAGVLFLAAYCIFEYICIGSWVVSEIVALLLAVVAIFLLCRAFKGKTGDRVPDEGVALAESDFEKEVTQTFLPEDTAKNRQLSEKRRQHCHTYRFGCYLWEGDPLFWKRGKDGHVRTSCYGIGRVLLFSEAVAFGLLRLSLLSEEDRCKQLAMYRYAELLPVQALTPSLPVEAQHTAYLLLQIRDREGKLLLSLPAPADSETDALLEELNRRIATAA